MSHVKDTRNVGFSEQCSKNTIRFIHYWHPKPLSQQEHFNHDGRAYNMHDQRQQ